MPTNHTQSDNSLSFTASGPFLYQMQDGASQLDIIDQLESRLGQLTAMLSTITGEGLENFRGLSEENQAYYLWGCQSLSVECGDLVSHLSPSSRTENRGREHASGPTKES